MENQIHKLKKQRNILLQDINKLEEQTIKLNNYPMFCHQKKRKFWISSTILFTMLELFFITATIINFPFTIINLLIITAITGLGTSSFGVIGYFRAIHEEKQFVKEHPITDVKDKINIKKNQLQELERKMQYLSEEKGPIIPPLHREEIKSPRHVYQRTL